MKKLAGINDNIAGAFYAHNDAEGRIQSGICEGHSAQAGYTLYRPEVDDDSIDIGLAGSGDNRPRLEMQLKCTGAAVNIEQKIFPFDLQVKNYDDLRAESIVPRLLVVVFVPEEITAWTKQTEQELCIRRCGYWYSLANMPDTNNNETVRIHIPRSNIFSVEFLQETMRRIAAGEWL